jgi:thymidine kinase
MAKLYFRYSAMGAGKSLDLIKVAWNYAERGMRTQLYNAALDTRFGERCVASRTGIRMEATAFTPDSDFRVLCGAKTRAEGKPDCVLVDEAQFLSKAQVLALRGLTDDPGVPVICYGLRTDFRGELFEGSLWLLAWADTIEELKTICWCGRKAVMNARVLDGRIAREGEQIAIGGNESYVALCWRHYTAGQVGEPIPPR